jgi:hypothetical protein
MVDYGVSLSVKQCRNFDISSKKCLLWLLKDCGFRRFRLMSYWDEIEPAPGQYDFKELDKQLGLIIKYKGSVTLCLGARQPRWPENHWPDWAWQLPKAERTQVLLDFIEKVIKRYKNNNAIVSYQLENEALLKSFGTRAEVDRQRLRQEFALIKHFDPTRPIIMSTSTSWGIPWRHPIPDIVGFSYYQTVFNADKQRYTTAFHKVWLHRLRAFIIKLVMGRPSFIHELQLEPWGSNAIWNMNMTEQMKSMSPKQIQCNIAQARKIGFSPVDLWGGEWWYWSAVKNGNSKIIDSVLEEIMRVN